MRGNRVQEQPLTSSDVDGESFRGTEAKMVANPVVLLGTFLLPGRGSMQGRTAVGSTATATRESMQASTEEGLMRGRPTS